MNKIQNKVLSIVKKYAFADTITISSKIYYDLNISGDDAYEMIDELMNTFKADLCIFLDNGYFPSEATALFYHWARLLGFKPKKFKSLTVKMICDTITKG